VLPPPSPITRDLWVVKTPELLPFPKAVVHRKFRFQENRRTAMGRQPLVAAL
jgi:hypothetical protein